MDDEILRKENRVKRKKLNPIGVTYLFHNKLVAALMDSLVPFASRKTPKGGVFLLYTDEALIQAAGYSLVKILDPPRLLWFICESNEFQLIKLIP